MLRAACARLLALLALTVVLLAGTATAASAADLYLAPDGADTGDCQTETAPCQTVDYVQSQAAAVEGTPRRHRVNLGVYLYVEEERPAGEG